MKYLYYKILNALVWKFCGKHACLPMLSFVGKVDFSNSHSIHFDLSDRTTHLGDRLFFFPLVVFLVGLGHRVTLSQEDSITNKLLREIYGFEVPSVACIGPQDLAVIPQPSYLSLRDGYRGMLVVNFSDATVGSCITQGLINGFCQIFGLSLDSVRLASLPTSQNYIEILDPSCRYYLFSNYINSGFFRRWFLNEDKLDEKCRELKSEGFKIVHVGTDGDKSFDDRIYPFVDLDMRGKLDLPQLIQLTKSNLVEGAVTYDNFLMHLCGIYHKTAYVLFRGRFSKSAREHHYRHVNNTFFSASTKLTYL